jgi:hypothetical protein
MIYMVALSGGYLVNLEDGFRVYEVDKDLVFPVRKKLGIHTLQNCRTVQNVRDAVAHNENRTRIIFHADEWPELFDILAFQSDEYAWDGRNPEVVIIQNEEAIPEAEVWLDKTD